MSYACQTNPERFLQPGELADWHTTPEAEAAIHACTVCPIRTACLEAALTAGDLDDNGSQLYPDGIIQGGIVCTGDLATRDRLYLALGRPVPDPVECCIGCERRFVETTAELGNDAVHRAHRGMCWGCYSAARRTGTIARARKARPTHCVGGCARPLATRSNPQPGHVRHERDGLCVSCARTESRKAAA